MNLKTGKSMKVRKGILCPYDPEFDLSGWQGRIIDVREEENRKNDNRHSLRQPHP
jgi:hypothetical protein